MAVLKDIIYLHNLIAIAYSDGAVCERETRYLRRRAEAFSVRQDDLDRMIANAKEFHVVKPLQFENRMEFLSECVDMALADGKLSPAELEMCLGICRAMQLDRIHLDEMIALKKITVL